ncbi:SigB/SigF/SigG family RNA polymerase sigma factor [Arthrobacter tumbae]|uniref:sigma-70 family RNA polymerase sigma factor n=1 Tax=Arthrobacter tumbae TaxID=163874 RepID=UPI00195CEC11|nr:sigma-70 family RNA polymerase sigma factor [Arthrobacter tumbae]MBM7782100.1 RNA polymerase sigma-B factor [Arthrobacter tumbae]
MRTAVRSQSVNARYVQAQPRRRGRLQAAMQEEIALDHLHLAEAIARGFSPFANDAADVRQVAYLGLMKAARRFDPELGIDFAAYAVPTIRGEVKRYLRDCCWMIRPPRELQDLKSTAVKADSELAQRLGREPSLSELSEHLGKDPATVAEALSCGGSQRPESLDASTEGLGWAEILPADDDPFAHADDVLALRAAVHELSAREKELLYRRYFHEETQDRIARRLGMTQMQVSRLLARTLVKLQKRLLDEPSVRGTDPAPVLQMTGPDRAARIA